MPPQPNVDGRSGKLQKLFRDVLNGKRKTLTSADAKLFIEAILCHEVPSVCAEKLFSSPNGLEAIRSSVRADLSISFMQSCTLELLQFLSAPEIKALAEGQILDQILQVIVNPPMVWNRLVKSFLDQQIEEKYLTPFAWLTHELLTGYRGSEPDVLPDARAIIHNGRLLESTVHTTRELAYKIEKTLQLKASALPVDASFSPGGRHDNDFADYRQIMIYPTSDELLSDAMPYYRQFREVFEVQPNGRAAIHLDNQFRLLREDMLVDLREEIKIALGAKKRKRASLVLRALRPVGIELGDERRGKMCSLAVTCGGGLGQFMMLPKEKRKKFLLDNRNFLKHQAFGALLRGDIVCGFAFVDRDMDMLCQEPPVVCLQFTDSKTLGRVLLALKFQDIVNFVVVDSPVFAYEPVLDRLKKMNKFPLQDILLDVEGSAQSDEDLNKLELSGNMQRVISKLRKLNSSGMDPSQLDALTGALEQRVSAIQGPPGTGKSFVGSHIAKTLFFNSKLRIMVIAYTNHALDQFLEELLVAGIPESDMVRLGSKSTEQTAKLSMPRFLPKHTSPEDRGFISKLKVEQSVLRDNIDTVSAEYFNLAPSFETIMEHLEFSKDDRPFHDAFIVPSEDSNWKRVGRKGRVVQKDYLFNRWNSGENPGIYMKNVPKESQHVWDMKPFLRSEYLARWIKELIQEKAEHVEELTDNYNMNQQTIDNLNNWGKIDYLRSKRVISCTTTAAAMQQKLISSADPDVVIVEEAGEILECHVLAAMAPSVKQLILIGDHKQLRPKVKSYALSVEKGEGYNLNMSLFERLVIQGFKNTTLRKQHRMHPEISRFPRALTYPDLEDATKVFKHPEIEGLRDRVIFVNHEYPETELSQISDRRDFDTKGSKQNEFEAVMVLRIVKYLAQQGYGTDKMVVLTPYLGQLRLLRDRLEKENDPILNDLDAAELIRAGLMTQTAAKLNKKPLRISTIDNYQGEESDIVIASFTRSNKRGEIGFMAAPERLNVFITRARNCLIMIGNMDTFNDSKAKATWKPFFELLKEHSHLYDGFPIRCKRHPERIATPKAPEDFNKYCPDGGCTEPCGTMLKCGIHQCGLRCHQVVDHAQMECTVLVEKTCDRKHKTRIICKLRKQTCPQCVKEDEEQERRIRRDLELEQDRVKCQEAYNKQLAEIQDKIDHQRRVMKYMTEAEEQKKTLDQQHKELESLKETASRISKMKTAQANLKEEPAQKPKKTQREKSASSLAESAQEEWELCKELEGARNKTLDKLMDMIGLEEVKMTFLEIKAKVDTKVRQNVALTSERFNCTLLGNPGTGKTTVARLYAEFLTSVGVLPGSHFEETTGSKLANLGVSGCQKLVEGILNDGGGVLFIDEAYQLTSGTNPGGGAVLDYLLPEVENLTGKVAFVLAGYNKQMESFFAHNPGLPSRFPIEVKFADYTDEELLGILGLKITKQYGGTMKCEDGLDGLFCRIVARRVGRGRGREGFGNARTIENTLARITQRQATRLTRERRARRQPDDLLLTKEDLIGPEPSEALAKSTGWSKLTQLVGLKSVKQAVRALVSSVEQNYQRELAEQPPIEYSLNKVFLGNPGTGKTTVAKLYGQILVDLELLSKGEVVVKNPSDFVGGHLGQSEQQTKGILAASLGKVLVIDEAYGLYGGGDKQGSTGDPFKTAVVDTIVAEVQSVPGDDRCVLLLGYRDNMETMFQNVNPGLSRRFPLASAFEFEDFDEAELSDILSLKLGQQAFKATGQARDVVMEMLSRARNRPHFGNAGEIDILLDTAKARHQSRLTRGESKLDDTLEAVDFDENFNRAQSSETDVRKLFEGTVGSEDIVDRLLGYQETVRTMKALDMDPKENIPFNFLFRGPPGTGKTTTAKKMGKVFYDMGFLATADVVECSATDMIGQYIGQTGPKVQALLDKALGRVLFIDEAYRLADGHFASDAINELVDSVTKDRYKKKLVIILAGYESDINRLMSVNEGLTSRFPEVINFRGLGPQECMSLLMKIFMKQKIQLQGKGISFDLTVLDSPTSSFAGRTTQLFSDLSKQPSWASARDVQTLGRQVFNEMIKSKEAVQSKRLVVEERVILSKLEELFKEREARGRMDRDNHLRNTLMNMGAASESHAPPKTTTTSTSASVDVSDNAPEPPPPQPEEVAKQESKPPRPSQSPGSSWSDQARRDAGVSDAVWEQLQRDRQAEQEREDEYQKLLEEKDTATEAARELLVKKILEEERRREEEAAKRMKLQQMGLCPVGYHWIKQGAGYRCAGGSHFLSDDQIQYMLK